MEKLCANVYFGNDPIVMSAGKGVWEEKDGRGRVTREIPKKIIVKKPDRYFEVEYENDKQYDSAMGEMRRKIEEATKGKNPYGVLIY